MGIDFSVLAHPKGPLHVEDRRTKRLTAAELEDRARRIVRARDGQRCAVPGCRAHGAHLHHIVYRSQSRRLKWHTSNLCFLCVAHHQLEHGGKITITGNADEHLTITGDKKALSFKL